MATTQSTLTGRHGSLMATRKGTILVATVCAVAAAAIIIYALNRYRQNINNGNTPQTVLVASSVIQKGTAGTTIAAEQLFRPATIVAKQASPGAIVDTAALTGKVAVTTIYPGQQLTAADFAATGGITTTLGADQRAVSVPLGSASGLVGNLAAGDYVDVYVGFTGNSAGRVTPVLRLLTSDIRVLQAPSSASSAISSSGGAQANVVLAVNQNVAPQLMFASQNGTLWLALRPGNASNPNPNEVVTLSSILLGNAPIASTGGKP